MTAPKSTRLRFSKRRRYNPFRVAVIHRHADIQVSCRAGVTIVVDGISADRQILNSCEFNNRKNPLKSAGSRIAAIDDRAHEFECFQTLEGVLARQ
jgi:hypothetical protein